MEVRPNVDRGHPSCRAGDRVALGDSVLILSLFALLMITYGFELFNVSLNADEAYWATLSRDTLFREAVAGGRWVLALTVLSSPVVVAPALDLAVGLSGMTLGLWWMTRRIGGMSLRAAFATLAVSVCLPWTALNLAFGLNAKAFGVAFVSLAAYGHLLQEMSHWSTAGAAFAVAVAFGSYEAFGLGALAVLGLCIVLNPTTRMATRAGLTLAGGITASVAITAILRIVFRVPANPYVNDAVQGWRRFISEPFDTLVGALGHVIQSTGLTGSVFGRSLPWLLGLTLVVTGPLIGELAATDLPRRAMVYLPVVCTCLAVIAYRAFPFSIGLTLANQFRAIAALCGLLTFGLAALTSVALESSDLSASRDRHVAFQIDEQIKLTTPDRGSIPRAVIVMGSEGWRQNDAFPARELLGLSAFSSTPWFSASYLKLQGLAVKAPTPQQYDRAVELLSHMPRYPESGWVKVEEDLVLVRIDDCPTPQCTVAWP